MDLLTALVEIAVGAATLTGGAAFLRSGSPARRVLGGLLAAAGFVAVIHGGAALG